MKNCSTHPDYNPAYGLPTRAFYLLMGDEFGQCIGCWKACAFYLQELIEKIKDEGK